jgi:uncharacterized protein (TIGR03086 family)
MNIAEADAAAVRDTIRLTAGITGDDLKLPTPCADWDLGVLLTHMTVQHRGFAAAAEGNGADETVWHLPPDRWLPDLVRAYGAAADRVITAFAAPDILDREFTLAEFSTERTFPGHMAVGFHLVDYVVHGWDVARALGRPFAPDPQVAAAALVVARSVPTGAVRLAPGAPFGPALDVPADADPFTETLRLLGRDPAWTPTSAGTS